MKKFILFVIIINLFASNIVNFNITKKIKDLNITGKIIYPTLNMINDLNISGNIIAPTHKTMVGYKKNIIDKVNYFTPDFLQISKETSFVNVKVYFDSLKKEKISASTNVRIKLPEFFLTRKKTKPKKIKNTTANEISSFTLKIRPFIKLKKEKFFFLQNILEYKIKYLNNEFGVSNKINYYPFDSSYEESLNIAYFKHLNHIYGSKFNISTNKDDFPVKQYSINFFISKFKNKILGAYGYNIGGSTDKKPVIYYHKFFIDFRRTLFNKKYIFLEVIPYILISKEYNYNIKPAVYSSLNIKF
jgi:hypothetical protein